jgi:hypothetical protein
MNATNINIVFLGLLAQLKTDHWQTTSFAEHKALATAYEALDGLFDTFVEVLYGKNGIPNFQNGYDATYKVAFKPYNNDMIGRYSALKKETMELVYEAASDSRDLQNISDEILAEFNHLLYRLQQK